MTDLIWVSVLTILATTAVVVLLFLLVAIYGRLSSGRWPTATEVVEQVEQLAALVLPFGKRRAVRRKRKRSAASAKAADRVADESNPGVS